jgi:hypothetical protein
MTLNLTRKTIAAASGSFHDKDITGIEFDTVLRTKIHSRAIGLDHIIHTRAAWLATVQAEWRMKTIVGQNGSRHGFQETNAAYATIAAAPLPGAP